jgi:hypothetical protein
MGARGSGRKRGRHAAIEAHYGGASQSLATQALAKAMLAAQLQKAIENTWNSAGTVATTVAHTINSQPLVDERPEGRAKRRRDEPAMDPNQLLSDGCLERMSSSDEDADTADTALQEVIGDVDIASLDDLDSWFFPQWHGDHGTAQGSAAPSEEPILAQPVVMTAWPLEPCVVASARPVERLILSEQTSFDLLSAYSEM